jgi:hypothetical protein
MHPRSKHWHLIDYVLVRRRDLRDVTSVRTMRGAECWTDHRLVRAKLRLVLKPKMRKTASSLPKRLNVTKLKSPGVKSDFQTSINAITLPDPINLWNEFRDKVYEAASDNLGYK